MFLLYTNKNNYHSAGFNNLLEVFLNIDLIKINSLFVNLRTLNNFKFSFN